MRSNVDDLRIAQNHVGKKCMKTCKSVEQLFKMRRKTYIKVSKLIKSVEHVIENC